MEMIVGQEDNDVVLNPFLTSPESPPQLSEAMEITQAITYWFIVCSYVVLTVVCVYAIWNSLKAENQSSVFSIATKFLLPICTILRCVDMGTNFGHNYMTQISSQQSVPSIIVGGLPGYIFISAYLLIALYWVSIYHKAMSDQEIDSTTIWMIYFAVNCGIYSIWIWLIFLMLIFPNQLVSVVHPMEGLYAASLNILSCLVVMYYGLRLLSKLKSSPVVSKKRLKTFKKIGILTLVLTVLYLIRAGDIILDIFAVKTPLEALLSRIVFLVLCEIVPIGLILFAFSPSTNTNNKDVPLSTNNSNRYYVVRA